MSIVTLTEDECMAMLGSSCNAAFRRFSTGVRQSLLRADFLKSHDITTLQALVLHMAAVTYTALGS
ncbi:C6 zinc finger protein [Colletotrichum gloeosporioides Cg-14]|uniref:C6 zinc finger protein n=1 Tax=Colletotrichum gloeosporioides (strain Cg-14) TaxID=1237896 RepID=T0JYI1_COLGC|nr:C6 zinc finger protein [Colletotrichum gloeosporioides Cg-14]